LTVPHAASSTGPPAGTRRASRSPPGDHGRHFSRWPERQASTDPWLPCQPAPLFAVCDHPLSGRRAGTLPAPQTPSPVLRRRPRLPRHRGPRLLQRACRTARPRSLPPGQGDHANRWEATFLPLTAARVGLRPLPRLKS
jgi:hypothetical protein